MRLVDVVATADKVAATSSRTGKVQALAALLRRLSPREIEPAVGFLVGEPRQGRVGVGWRTVASVDASPAGEPSLTIADVDGAVDRVRSAVGPGSAAERNRILEELFGAATGREQDFLRRLFTGELRQGALEGVMVEAVAKAADVPARSVRRAHMLSGDLERTAVVALSEGTGGLDAVGLEVLRPVRPMLASTAEGPDEALSGTGPASVEWKLDGVRIQVHRRGGDVRVFTRNLNDVTERLPEVARAALELGADPVVLDGEAILVDPRGRPHPFQETMSRVGRLEADATLEVDAWFFDVLHADGADLIDRPLGERIELLARICGDRRMPGIVTEDPSEASSYLAEVLEAGHEGVMVKALDSTYEAGRRGKSWRKVKPAHTLDLVVLGAEWGHGRRRGWLSNLHLGARGEDGGFVMVGKTFKGLTDEMLTWQTEHLLGLEERREGIVVHVRPSLVVEIALDGVQSSTRYPGGVALRFARVKGYRTDKDPADADTIGAVRDLVRSRGYGGASAGSHLE